MGILQYELIFRLKRKRNSMTCVYTANWIGYDCGIEWNGSIGRDTKTKQQKVNGIQIYGVQFTEWNVQKREKMLGSSDGIK